MTFKKIDSQNDHLIFLGISTCVLWTVPPFLRYSFPRGSLAASLFKGSYSGCSLSISGGFLVSCLNFLRCSASGYCSLKYLIWDIAVSVMVFSESLLRDTPLWKNFLQISSLEIFLFYLFCCLYYSTRILFCQHFFKFIFIYFDNYLIVYIFSDYLNN